MTIPTFGMKGQKVNDEVFPDYSGYLATTIWPSVDNGGKIEEPSDVTAVDPEGRHLWPPQRGAASLAKLVRWARWEPSGQCATIDDPDVREEFVRTMPLGLALASRALNMTEANMFGLYGEPTQESPAQASEVVADLAVALGEDYPAWSLQERVSLALKAYTLLDPIYLIKKRRAS